MSLPTASEPAEMLMVALPLVSVVAPEEYAPLVRVTEPVGVGVPATVTVTESVCAVEMLKKAGVTVTVGVVREGVA